MTAAQRATLAQMADQRTSRGAYGQGWREIDREELDALRAALGTCGNCAHLIDMLCLTDQKDHPGAQQGRLMVITHPDTFGCTGWTAKEGA